MCLNYLPSYLADYSFYSLPAILSNWRRLFRVISVISGMRLEQSHFRCNPSGLSSGQSFEETAILSHLNRVGKRDKRDLNVNPNG